MRIKQKITFVTFVQNYKPTFVNSYKSAQRWHNCVDKGYQKWYYCLAEKPQMWAMAESEVNKMEKEKEILRKQLEPLVKKKQ